MKKFEVEMEIRFTKTIHIEAPNEDAAVNLAETMLLCTDALPLTDEDMVCLTTSATELGKGSVHAAVPVEDDEDDSDDDDECFCCGDCTICDLCDEEDDDLNGEDETPVTASGKPMSLDEMMLHLSMYMEDAEDQLADVQAALSSIERFARAIIKAQRAKASTVQKV